MAVKKKKPRPNKVYARKIDALIPDAMKEAKAKTDELGRDYEKRKGADGLPYNHWFVSQFFHQAMNRMAREAGLR